jgi:hypothetical protein
VRQAGNWLDTYLSFCEQSEAPDTYHIWTGVSIVAAALRRKVWLDMGYFRVYPNMYVVLVGPPGCRKNSAINIGISMLDKMPDIKFSADAITREALIQVIASAKKAEELAPGKIYVHSSVTIVSKELSVFLGKDNQELLSLLTDLYDNHDRWEYRTKNKGTDVITGEWLNLLGGSTPTWLVGSVSLNAIGGGFTSRIIFVVEDQPRKKNAFPILSKQDLALRDILVIDLEIISQKMGEMKMNKIAMEFFRDWYENLPLDEITTDPRFEGYFERKHIHLIKTSMILSACRSDDLIIELDDVQKSLYMLDQLESKMINAFGSAGRSMMAADIDEVIKLLKKQKEVERGELMRGIWRNVDYRTMDQVLNAIREMGLIDVVRRGAGITARTIYVWKEK